MELLWPLAIFLILAKVRERRPAEHKEQGKCKSENVKTDDINFHSHTGFHG